MNTVKGSITKWLLLLFLVFPSCTSTTDTITPSNPIRDGDVLVSSGQSWALGFFSPNNSTRRYVGIWYYKVPEQTVIWAANRDHPINGTSGTLTINPQGNLVVYEDNQSVVPVWSTNASASAANNYSVARLLDTGNLVLVQQHSKRVLWQSFDYPTDTLLPFMKLGLNRRTGFIWFLSSWKSRDDPGIGDVFFRIDPIGYPQLFLYKGSRPLWRGGPWTGLRWSGVPQMTNTYIFRVNFVNNDDEVSIAYGVNKVSNSPIFTKMMVNESGYVQRSTWNDHDHRWIEFWSAPKEQCDNYGECGANSYCDPYGDPGKFICNCVPGYEPKSPRDWYLRDGSRGCIRKPGSSACRSNEGFVKLARVKVPDTSVARADMGLSLKQCEQKCLENCSCTAYASADERGSGCLMWFGDMVDTRSYSNVGQDILIRVDAAELAKYEKSKSPLAKRGIKAVLIVSVALASFFILFFVYWFVKRKRKAEDEHVFTSSTYLEDSPAREEHCERGTPTDLPLFDLSTIAAATNNFSTDNMLGEGGFGAVYKGILHDGKEIAVKRLSKNSGQGSGEFMTEVALIAKLQHRNLVRILGCCIKNREKMLVYEYLPNKSLDSVIFGMSSFWTHHSYTIMHNNSKKVEHL
uniref:non-specific serine/threonine protein kinase n=1 Tax=Rhizophora mucronata TaxID=61149 RepID=A0A2P2II72_RHIMU